MDYPTMLSIISTEDISWSRVRDFPCIQTFQKDYYINLCKYQRDGLNIISVNMDDVVNNISDVFDEEYQIGSSEFEHLNPIYEIGKDQCVTIDDLELV